MDAPAKEKKDVPVDLLGRQEIVDRIMKILEVISEKRSSCTFALNGAWGTGKTFVLNMLMNQLWEYHSDKYIVFHYNCWQYDYYEEPLIAIVAAMLDSVDEENHLLPAHLRDKAKAGMELAKPVLQKIATDFVKNKIGVDLTEVVSSAKAYQEALDSEKQKRADDRVFDGFYSFKKAIQQAQEQIRKLAKDRTLVVVVDELDRCLPSYAIKVLERLHHLFLEMDNTSVLMAVDKTQLDATVKQIFGMSTETTNYLRKFINFEISLDTGNRCGNFWSKYRDYFDMFDENLLNSSADFDFDSFFNALFTGIDIRSQERIMERIKLIHSMLFPARSKDYSFMCCELLWVVTHEINYGCATTIPISKNGKESARIMILKEYTTQQPNYLDNYLDIEYSLSDISLEFVSSTAATFSIRCSNAILKALLFYVNQLQNNPECIYTLSYNDPLRHCIFNNLKDLHDFVTFLELVD